MYLKYIVFFVFVIAGLLFNAQMPTKVIDQVQMVTVAGYDKADRNNIRGTVVTPKYLTEGKVEDEIYTDTAATIYENRVQLNAKATERLQNGKLKVAFYNQELAEQGIKEFIRFMTRDPSIGGNVFVAITEGSTVNFINTVQTGKGKGVFFTDLFEHNIQHGNLPRINLKVFENSLLSETCDPFLPMFGIKGEKVELQSIAFFDDDQLVDTLPIDQADVFRMLYESVNDGHYQYTSDKYNLSVENIESNRNIRVDIKNENAETNIEVQFQGAVREFTGRMVADYMQQIESDIEQDIKQQAEGLISRFQELNIDPLDIEGHARSSNRNYDQDQFKAAYPEMPVNVDVNVTLTETGTRR